MSELLTYRQVANRYGFKLGTLYALVHDCRIPHVKFSLRFIRFRAAELEEWIAEHVVAADPPSAVGTSTAGTDRKAPVRVGNPTGRETPTAIKGGTANGK